MDIPFRIGRLNFIWDQEKAEWNNVKHGVSFQEAAEVFIDPLAQFEDADSEDEEHSAAIGMTREPRLLFVVHVEREDDLITIISARPADARERKTYENHA